MSITTFPTFSAAPFDYEATYTQVALTWAAPGAGTDLVLVRNLFNAPSNNTDGTVLLQVAITEQTTYTDNPTVPAGGGFVYYSLFVSDSSGNWYRAGDVQATVPGNWSYGAHLWDLIPSWYKVMDQALPGVPGADVTWAAIGGQPWTEFGSDTWLGATGDFASTLATPPAGPLQRFLLLLATQLDRARTLIEQLALVNDPNTVAGDLLPLLAYELGVGNEDALGMAQMRHLVSEVVHLYRTKGTVPGIQDVVSAVTGWGAEIEISPNLALYPDLVANLTTPTDELTGNNPNYQIVGFGGGNPIMPGDYAGLLGPTNWPADTPADLLSIPAQAWFPSPAVALSDLTELNWTTLFGADPVSYGIPIPMGTGTTTISASIRVWSAGINPIPTFTLGIHFWGQFGNDLGVGATTEILPSDSTWTQAAIQGAAVPEGATWVSLEIAARNPSGNLAIPTYGLIILAMPQVEEGPELSPYTNPRDIGITLDADRTNLALNPSFENGTTSNWTPRNNCSIAATNTISHQPSVTNPGIWSCIVTATSDGNMTVAADAVPLAPGGLVTTSAYLLPSSFTTSEEAIVEIELLSENGTTLAIVAGALVLEDTHGGWVRASAQIQPSTPAPSDATQARMTITWAAVPAGESHYFDDVLIEEVWGLGTYFDGSVGAGGPTASDYLWNDPGAQTGPSWYYGNRIVKTNRLESVLLGTGITSYGQGSPFSTTGFLPFGSSYTLFTEQPLPVVTVGDNTVPNTWGNGRWGVSRWTGLTYTGGGGWGYGLWGTAVWGDTGAPTLPTTPGSTTGTGVVGSLTIPNELLIATANETYSASLGASGGTTPYNYTVTEGELPSGLILNPATGEITGTPTTAGTVVFSFLATDSSVPVPLSARDTYSLQVNATPPNLMITVGSGPPATGGAAYSFTLSAAGGTTPYTWALLSAGVPGGWALSTGGVLTATSAVAETGGWGVGGWGMSAWGNTGPGEVALEVKVTDHLGNVATATLEIEVI